MEYSWWNQIPLHLDPTAFSVFGFSVRWYGLMYLAAFFCGYHLIWYFAKKEPIAIKLKREQLDSVMTWLIGGVIVGARLGYVFFYNFDYYSSHLSEIILPFSFSGGFHFTGISGMSYHGGLIGSFAATSFAIIKQKLDYWKTVNLIFLVVPAVYTFGRFGNFINGELYGRITTANIGMIFPHAPEHPSVLRHPSQLYEMFFEGIFLFAVLFVLLKFIPRIKDHLMAFYLIGYGLARFFIEFFREPDAQIGLNGIGMSRGQILCSVMILSGIALCLWRANVLSKTPLKKN